MSLDQTFISFSEGWFSFFTFAGVYRAVRNLKFGPSNLILVARNSKNQARALIIKEGDSEIIAMNFVFLPSTINFSYAYRYYYRIARNVGGVC